MVNMLAVILYAIKGDEMSMAECKAQADVWLRKAEEAKGK